MEVAAPRITPETGQSRQRANSGQASTKAPPYWQAHHRTISNVSYESVEHLRGSPVQITLEDNSDIQATRNQALWAKGVTIHDYVVVGGTGTGSTFGAGSYVVWNCTVEMLEGGTVVLRKRYSEFDTLRRRLMNSFPQAASALPTLPPKSVISRFRVRFLEKRREGLAFFLNCVLLNPEFAGCPVLKEFIFT